MVNKVSVETDHLTKAATRYDSVSTNVNNLLNSFLSLEHDLSKACGDDESGRKIHTSIENIKHSLVKDTRLFAEVTGLTGDGVRDMHKIYEQTESAAEQIANGANPEDNLGSAHSNNGQNNNSSNTNTSGNGRKNR